MKDSNLLHAVKELSRQHRFGGDELEILEDVDAAAEAIAPAEVEAYLNRQVNTEVFSILKKFNLSGLPISRDYGGRGANALVSTLAYERLGQVYVGLGAMTSMALGAKAVEAWGDARLKQRYLVPACRGDVIFAFALTEPGAGSDLGSLGCTYRKEGGVYLLNGTKYLVTNGVLGTAILTFARSEGGSDVTAFVVDRGAPGLSATALKEKMGGFTSDLGMLEYRGVEVAPENVLGPLNGGKKVAYSAFMSGRLRLAAACVGATEDCLASVVERVKERTSFGKQIGKHQLVQQHIAKIVTNLEASRWLTYNAAVKLMEWEADGRDGSLRDAADLAITIAKKAAGELAWESADRAVQVFGGFGYSILSAPTRHLLDLRVARVGEGSDEILSLKIAAATLGRGFEAYS